MTDYIDISQELRKQRDQYGKLREDAMRVLRILEASPGSDLKAAMEEYLVSIDAASASLDEALKTIPKA